MKKIRIVTTSNKKRKVKVLFVVIALSSFACAYIEALSLYVNFLGGGGILFIGIFFVYNRYSPSFSFCGEIQIVDNSMKIFLKNGNEIVLPLSMVKKCNVYFSGTAGSGGRYYVDDGGNNKLYFAYNEKWYSFNFYLKDKTDLYSLKDLMSNISEPKRFACSSRFTAIEKKVFKKAGVFVKKESLDKVKALSLCEIVDSNCKPLAGTSL